MSVIINSILLYAVINLMLKNETNEETITTQQESVENSKSYIEGLSNLIKDINIKLKEIDVKGSFKSDDEIGWFFKDVLYIGDILNNFNNSNNAEEKKTKDN